MSVRIKIADTYKRLVEIELPGDGLEPMKAEITAIYYDIDPTKQASEQEVLNGSLKALFSLMTQLKAGELDQVEVEKVENDLAILSDVKPKIDRILAGVEGLEVVDHQDNPLTGQALLDFVKRYPRIREPIIKKWDQENGQVETPALGNLARSVRLGLGSGQTGQPATTQTKSAVH